MSASNRPALQSRTDYKRNQLKTELRQFCEVNALTFHELWSIAKQMIDEEFASTFSSDEEKTADVLARIKNVRETKELNSFGRRADARVEGIKHARTLFGFGLREAVDFVDVLLAKNPGVYP